MKKLNELYPMIDSDVLIKSVKINSKEVEEGDLFVCTMGVTADRHDFIDDAVKNGAAALIVSKDVSENRVPVIKVPDTNREMPFLCQKFYDYPDKLLKMIGITGTDGKTSVASIVQTLIGSDVCGYIGTNGRSCAKFSGDIPNTTPDADKLYAYFRDFVDFGCKYVVKEASSEAFFRGRLQSIKYDVSVYTNITSEHLNIHGSFENYMESKLMLFKQTKPDGYCILNADDFYYEKVKEVCIGKVLTYGKGANNTLQIVDFSLYPDRTNITFKYEDKTFDIESPLLGDFNVYNLAAAILTCIALDFSLDMAIKNIDKLKVSGRLEMLNTEEPFYVMVDYAHTPNGIAKLLNFVKTLDINRSIVVIGQAGERDYFKRPEVGEIVLKNCSYAIFTSEDPRSEDPYSICEDMIKTCKDTHNNYEIEVDRRKAIEKAINMAKEKDMVLILGKGNETYQKLKDETIYFNDIEECYVALANRKIKESMR